MMYNGVAMTTRRTVLASLAGLIVLIVSVSVAPAKSDDGAKQFIEELGDRAVAVLKDKTNTTFLEREAAFRGLLVDGFHIKTISRFVLGRFWKTASAEQRQKYDDVFTNFIVRVYASRFDSYNGETFEMVGVIGENGGDSMVRTRILRPAVGTAIEVDYRVRQIDGEYRVVDINVEGISMLVTHRQEFRAVINRKGFDGFLAELQARLDIPAKDKPVATAVN